MKMSRERKWLCGILGLGVGALALDQTLLGSPESANAQEGAGLIDSSESDLTVAPQEPSTIVEENLEGAADLSDFASRLEAANSLSQGQPDARDAFALPEHWQTRTIEVRPDNLDQVPMDTEVATFIANHTLVGTIVSETGDYAILEGKNAPINVRVGQDVDGFVLRVVADRATAWESKTTGERAILQVILPEIP